MGGEMENAGRGQARADLGGGGLISEQRLGVQTRRDLGGLTLRLRELSRIHSHDQSGASGARRVVVRRGRQSEPIDVEDRMEVAQAGSALGSENAERDIREEA